jgi:hypothetical protein
VKRRLGSPSIAALIDRMMRPGPLLIDIFHLFVLLQLQ